MQSREPFLATLTLTHTLLQVPSVPSHDKVGQGLIIFLPLAPGYGNDPHFLHALADVMMTSNVSSPAKG